MSPPRRCMPSRMLAQGARRADVGQGDAPRAVPADPEGSEFCVVQLHNSLLG